MKRGQSHFPKKNGRCPYFHRGMTFLEIILVITIISIIVGGVVISFSKALRGRSVDSTAEELAALVRSAQSRALDTETPQAIFLSKNEVLWNEYPNRTIENLTSNCEPEEGEKVRNKEFKDNVEITGLWIEDEEIKPVPNAPTENIAMLISEKGKMTDTKITIAKEKATNWIAVDNRQVAVGKGTGSGVAPVWLSFQSLQPPSVSSNEEITICKTESLLARGWQVITVDNVDKASEVKLKVKLDSRLPSSAHLHVYVFPCWYENKPIVHGVTGEQTMLDKMGSSPDVSSGQSPFSNDKIELYRESTNDCLFRNPSISGHIRKLNDEPISGVNVWVEDTYLIDPSTLTDNNGLYSFSPLPDGYLFLHVDNQQIGGIDYQFINLEFQTQVINIQNVENGAEIDFLGRRLGYQFDISGIVKDKNTEQGIKATINTVSGPNPFGISGYNWWVETSENGLYQKRNLESDIYYILTPFKAGYNFEPPAITLFVDEDITNVNFYAERTTESSFGGSTPPLGAWNESETLLQNNALMRSVAVWGEPKGHYVYKNKISPFSSTFSYCNTTQTLPMVDNIFFTPPYQLYTTNQPVNVLNPGGLSDFPTKDSVEFYYLDGCGVWKYGYPNSSLVYQVSHTGTSNYQEIQAGQWTEHLTIPLNSFPPQTKFLRIAIAAYNETDSGEELFNLYPTASSTNPDNATISANQLDYQTDPFIIYYPWHNWINDPFWLSLYGYALNALTPPLRPYGVNILARRGPYEGENYKNGEPYKGFWYGPLYLDWNLILGKESLYWLTGWTSSVFEMNSVKWRFYQNASSWLATFGQDIDTYGNTALASPPHYWLKNFAYLSYWYLFQCTAYSEESGYSFSLQDGSQPKRFQEPLNLSRTGVLPAEGSLMQLFERPDPTLYSVPWESSSLSIPFGNALYPLWLASLPTIFGQQKITSAPDLYSSFYYLQEKINHTMLDVGIWALFSSEVTEAQKSIVYENIYGGNSDYRTSPTCGNFEKFSLDSNQTLSCWWSWYQTIPWAKGQAFPRKTGPLSTDVSPRDGWEKPVITQPLSYFDYFSSTLIYEYNPTTSFNATQVVNAPHTIFMSTAHYPLGSIQIKVKK